MSIHYQWSSEKAEKLCEVINISNLNEKIFSHVFKFANDLLEDNIIPIEFISSFRQSSFITHRKDESAIFFDIGQSFILKNICFAISNRNGFPVIANILKQSGSLTLAYDNLTYAFFTNELPIDFSKQFYNVDQFSLKSYSNYLSNKSFLNPNHDTLIDKYIVGHELFHYLKHRKLLNVDDWKISNSYYDLALIHCCYHEQPNFQEIASLYGRIQLSEKKLKEMYVDLTERKKYYLRYRNEITEELTCDIFSFQQLMFENFRNEEMTESSLKDFCFFFYFLFCIFDLHLAMTNRFRHSLNSGIKSLKPSNIADMNFRKVAVLQTIYDCIIHYYYRSKSKQEIVNFYSSFQKEIFEFKCAIDSLFVVPTTLSLEDVLLRCEFAKDEINNVFDLEMINSFTSLIIREDQLFGLSRYRDLIKK